MDITLGEDGETIVLDGQILLPETYQQYRALRPELSEEEALRQCLEVGAAIMERGGFLEQDGESQWVAEPRKSLH